MPAEPAQPEPSSPEPDIISRGNRNRRTSERSIRPNPEQPESSNAPSTARHSFTRSSPQPGSSREMTPPEGAEAIKYTRTGRVCRANKGKRVHYCEECGKTYTRAEHLRRHQQNHKPGAFVCDVPGCGRSFHREDLLVRHKAGKHNDPHYPGSALSSPRSQYSASAGEATGELLSHPTVGQQVVAGAEAETMQTNAPQTVGRDSGSRMTESSIQKRSPEASIGQTRYPIPITVDGHSEYEGGGYISDSSVPYSASGYTSPTTQFFSGLPFHQEHQDRTRQSSSASYLGHYFPSHTSPSPVSTGSSTVYPPYWGNSAHHAAVQYLGGFSGPEDPYSSNIGGYNDGITDLQLLPEYRDLTEEAELTVNLDSSESSSMSFRVGENTYTTEDRYLAGYWNCVHPFFPIVHRPSFSQFSASPLLKASMIALSAQALGGASDKTNARIVHERCVKVLKKRSLKGSHSFRICDMQAVVLVEIFSIFKSRRPSLQFSKHFDDVYQLLASDPEAQHATPLEEENLRKPAAGGASPFNGEFTDNLFYPSNAEYKQRLLLACYMLDQQHALLFGRLRSNAFSGDGAALPFPRDQTSWDGNGGQHQDPEEVVNWPVYNIGERCESGQHIHDVFQSMYMVGSFFDSRRDAAIGHTFRSGDDLTVLPIVECSPRIKIAYHTFMLCENTPLRDLLAVAGESWIMSEKLSSQSDYMAAQIRTREWALGHTEAYFEFGTTRDKAQVDRAVAHALKILELHQSNSYTGLLFQEWSVYLASVVIWARSYVLSIEKSANSIQKRAEHRRSSHSLEQIVSSVVAGGSDRHLGLEEAIDILLWTKSKIISLWTRDKIEGVNMPHNCGLINGTLDVLGKLVARGAEQGWFGS